MNNILYFIFFLLVNISNKTQATQVSLVEVEMNYWGCRTGNLAVHQGLRFESGFKTTECHFGPSGLQVCGLGGFDTGCRIYSSVKKIGELDKPIEDCENWCKRWARRNTYGVGAVCWTLVGEFIRAHGLKKHAAVRDPKLKEDCTIQ